MAVPFTSRPIYVSVQLALSFTYAAQLLGYLEIPCSTQAAAYTFERKYCVQMRNRFQIVDCIGSVITYLSLAQSFQALELLSAHPHHMLLKHQSVVYSVAILNYLTVVLSSIALQFRQPRTSGAHLATTSVWHIRSLYRFTSFGKLLLDTISLFNGKSLRCWLPHIATSFAEVWFFCPASSQWKPRALYDYSQQHIRKWQHKRGISGPVCTQTYSLQRLALCSSSSYSQSLVQWKFRNSNCFPSTHQSRSWEKVG